MRLRPWHTFAVFAASLFVVAVAAGFVSATVLDLSRAEARARAQADLEERVRLALWRMDSSFAPVIARESARPPQAWGDPSGDGPSALLGAEVEHVQLFFQVGRDGALVSPQASAAGRGWASGLADPAKVEEARRRLARLREAVPVARIEEALAKAGKPVPPPAVEEPRPQQQAALGKLEWARRSVSVQQIANNNLQALEDFGGRNEAWRPGDPPDESVMVPLWAGSSLLLARRVRVDGERRIQGCLLDWESVERALLAEVRDLLPGAKLAALPDSAASDASRQLASLPVVLAPNAEPPPAAAGPAVKVILAVAWSGVLLAVVAVGLLLIGTLSLSERRAAFVSAVTHELRTPLTTFRLYTELLAEGMVTDEQKRRGYLETLHAESRRLGHLVENVLAFSRIERGRAGARIESLEAGALLERALPHLEERARQAGMEVVVEADPAARAAKVRADAAAVEQILFNLVDNACKYAAGAEEKRIALAIEPRGARVFLRVSDRGPGVAADVRRRLFSPFSRSAEKAAGSAPGVGLGLALSRRLARAMKGELRLEERPGGGASFVLGLPAA